MFSNMMPQRKQYHELLAGHSDSSKRATKTIEEILLENT
jgi:hypothetical protein